MSAPIDRDQVQHVGRLARLTLRDDEVPALTEQLVKILGFVAQLQEVSTDGIEPTAQVGVDRLPFRPDEPHACLPREVVLREAPETAGGGFVVPAFIQE